ncbi:proton-conducting transporter membrane subunit [Streptosporangium sp. NPDC005286]|uniref:proton-conducting transporter transmembrane domain-containing protein n=1 Tax=Streptosporangium sp. NPDC005286 TaxID=3154463 RepID=UPI0033A15816
MIALVPLLVAAVLLAASCAVARTVDRRRARHVAVVCATAAASVAALSAAPPLAGLLAPLTGGHLWGLLVAVVPDGAARFAGILTCLAGLLVVAMSPLAEHPPATLARILRLLAASSGFGAVGQGGATVALWALSAWLVWAELRRCDDGLARLFAAYQVPGVLLLGAGTALAATGHEEAGAVLVALALVIRLALVPAHGWYPRFVERAPMGVVVAFGIAPLGMLTRLDLLSAFPAQEVASLGVLTAVAAAVLAVVQDRARRALAFLMMSQGGLVAFGLGGDSPIAVSGALLTWQASALALPGFAMSLAALEARRGPLSLATPDGNFARTPRLAVAFLLCGLAGVGFPPSLGFAGDHLLVHGSVTGFPPAWPVLLGVVGINGMTVMKCFLTLFAGSRAHYGERDLVPLEAYALTIVIGTLLIGAAFPVTPGSAWFGGS